MNKLFYPLFDYNLGEDVKFENNELEISSDLKIMIINQDISNTLNMITDELSKNERKIIKENVFYWLQIKTNSSTEIVYIYQLACWIVKPTKLRICFQINANNVKEDLKKDIYLKLKEFEFIPEHVKSFFDNEDIIKLKRIFPVLLKLYKDRPIFYTAIGLNFQGCVAFHWDAAYILYVTTFEALLTHKSKWGIKKKLAWAYAILTEAENENRQIAFKNFRDIYKIRSEILHGESFENKDENGKLNLKELAKCRDMLRKLWQVIIDSDEMKEKLSGNDGDRRKYFKKVANGWMPEGIINKKRCNILYITFNLLKKLIGCNYSLYL